MCMARKCFKTKYTFTIWETILMTHNRISFILPSKISNTDKATFTSKLSWEDKWSWKTTCVCETPCPSWGYAGVTGQGQRVSQSSMTSESTWLMEYTYYEQTIEQLQTCWQTYRQTDRPKTVCRHSFVAGVYRQNCHWRLSKPDTKPPMPVYVHGHHTLQTVDQAKYLCNIYTCFIQQVL